MFYVFSMRLETRSAPSLSMMVATALLGGAALCAAGALLLHLGGYDPLRALAVLFLRPVGTVDGVAAVLLKATPLILCGVGLALAFRADVHNMGADGQLTMGAVAAGAIALACDGVPAPWLLPLTMCGGALGGMAWAAVPACLRTRFGASEILVSVMLVPVAHLLLRYLLRVPFHDATSLPATARLPLGAAFLLALAVVALAWMGLRRGRRQGGEGRKVWFALLCSGALAGIAGAAEVAGPLGRLDGAVTASYGVAAIAAAYLGRLHPAGVLATALLLALLHTGGQAAQAELGLPAGTTLLIQGMALFCLLAANALLHLRPVWRAPA